MSQTDEKTQKDYNVNHQKELVYDLIIIGSGPAGLSAALCASRAKLKTLILEKALPGGSCTTACNIDNLIGYPKGILGVDLAKKMEEQALAQDVDYHCEDVTDILNIHEQEKWVKTNLDSLYKTKKIILALGLEPKELDKAFAKRFLGRGVSYYAQGDFAAYRNEHVVVMGGGNCACYAAEYLASVVKKVTIVHQSNSLKAVQSLKDKILACNTIDIMWDSEVVDIFGIDQIEKIKIQHSITQQHTWLDAKAAFVYIGRIPPKQIISPEIDVDESGFIVTDEFMRTNIPGIYAIGDIRSKQVRQIASAISDGMLAAINVERDLSRIIPPSSL